jgi:hypothetical protein
MKNLNLEVICLNNSKAINEYVKGIKTSAKGIFALHRDVLKAYSIVESNEGEDLQPFELVKKSSEALIFTSEIDKKEFKPFNLLFGTLTLDKTIRAMKGKDMFSFTAEYVKAVNTYLSKDKDERQRILERGEAVNHLVVDFKFENIGGLTFAQKIVEFFPSFHENLKNGKVAPTVAKFLFEHDNEAYNTLKIKDVYDVQHEQKRMDVKKEFGNVGLIEFDKQHNNKVLTSVSAPEKVTAM